MELRTSLPGPIYSSNTGEKQAHEPVHQNMFYEPLHRAQRDSALAIFRDAVPLNTLNGETTTLGQPEINNGIIAIIF